MAKISQSLEEKSLNLDGKRVYYLEAGKGLPLILIHGWCGSADFFTGVIPYLAQKFHVLAPDLPGCSSRGKEGSEELDGKHTITAYVEFLRGFAICHAEFTSASTRILKQVQDDEKRVCPVNLLGVSMGGTIALEWAKNYPDEVLKVVAFEPNLGRGDISFIGKLMIMEGKMKFSRPLLRWIYAEASEREESFKRLSSKDKKALMDELYGASLRAASEAAQDLLNGMDAGSYRKIQSPTILLSGGLRTPIFSPQTVGKLSQIIPGAKVVKFPHGGHAFVMEDPEGFSKLVKDFLG